MRFAKTTLLAAGIALAACGGEPPPNDNNDPLADEAMPAEEIWETGIGEKPVELPQECASAGETMVGDVTLSGASRVKTLDENGVAVIDGNLYVGDVDSLEGLHCLREVRGDLVISGTESLKDVVGFGRLGSIEGSLWITENTQLASLRGFGALKSVGGDIVVERNEVLETLDGITDIGRGIRGGIYVRDNDALVSITGFERLEAMGGDLVIEANPSLDYIEGFWSGEAATVVYGNVMLQDNPVLGWAELPEIGTDRTTNSLWVTQNPQLKDLTMFGATKFRVTGDLVISENPALERLNGLDRINAVMGDVIVQANEELDTIEGLQGVKTVMGNVEIVANRSLDNVDMFHLEQVNGDFLIARNDSLVSLSGLESLTDVGGELTLFSNPELDTCYEGLLSTRIDTGRGSMTSSCF